MKKKSRKKVIGIVLTYNCASMVEDTYTRIPKHSFDEIIIIDDGSKDNIREIAKKIHLKFFTHKHVGYGGNMKYGLKKALQLRADYMVEIHGDGQYDLSIIPKALKKMEKGYRLLLGSRLVNIQQPLKDKMPLLKYVANIILSFIDRIILNINLTEFHSGFHIYSKEFISHVGFARTSNGHLYSLEIIAQACYKNLPVGEIPIRCDYAKNHTSISFRNSILYTLESFLLLAQYRLAKKGLKFGLFKHY